MKSLLSTLPKKKGNLFRYAGSFSPAVCHISIQQVCFLHKGPETRCMPAVEYHEQKELAFPASTTLVAKFSLMGSGLQSSAQGYLR